MAMREIKLCLLGDSGVGKSSIVQRFVCDTYQESVPPTIGASFMSKTLTVGDKSYKFQIWDTAGQEKYRGLAPMYYRGAAAAIVVYDITSQVTFKKVKDWVQELKQHGPDNIVVAIAGNKNDLEDLREITDKTASEYAKEIGAVFCETSAKTSINIKELFVDISQKLPPEAVLPYQPGTVTIGQNSAKGKTQRKTCCK